MCTTARQSAQWPTCRCECRGAYHGRTSPYGFMEVLIVLPESTDPGADEVATSWRAPRRRRWEARRTIAVASDGTALLRAAVGQLVRRSSDLLGLGGLAEPASIDQLRLAAVLRCPDPEGHAEVREHCLRPLDVTILRPDDDGTTAA